jgi:heat-inducible transcriptional repressor
MSLAQKPRAAALSGTAKRGEPDTSAQRATGSPDAVRGSRNTGRGSRNTHTLKTFRLEPPPTQCFQQLSPTSNRTVFRLGLSPESAPQPQVALHLQPANPLIRINYRRALRPGREFVAGINPAGDMAASSLQQKRHREVLSDVVRIYIETGEPVSSRSIARRHTEPLSPATVRNVMADLEEEGLLYQPHTSAGRVPTAAAYRFFVEEITSHATARPNDLEWIRRELANASTPEAVMERASKILSDVSRGLGIIISPPLARTVVQHLRFLLIPDGRVLVVLIGPGGITRDKLIHTERPFKQEELDRIADFLNSHYSGWTLDAIRADLQAQITSERERYDRLAKDALMLCDPQILGDETSRHVYIEGTARLITSSEFSSQEQLRELLSTIEERGRLISLLTGFIEAPEPVHVEFGLKGIASAGSQLALVTAPYSHDEQSQGTLGILGPIRMHYERVIAAVAFMADFFSEGEKGNP